MATLFNPSQDIFSQQKSVPEKPRITYNKKPITEAEAKRLGTVPVSELHRIYGGGGGTPAPAGLTPEEQARLSKIETEAELQKKEKGGISESKLIEIQRLKQKEFQLQAGTYGMAPAPAQAKEIQYQKQRIETFQKEYPQEKLVFGKQGEVTGIESGAYQKTFTLAEYNKQIERDIGVTTTAQVETTSQTTYAPTDIKIFPKKYAEIPMRIFAGDIGRELIRVPSKMPIGINLDLGVPLYKVKGGISEEFGKYKYGFLGQAVTEFIPETPLDIASYYGISKVYKFAPKLTKAGFETLGIYQIATGKTPKEKTVGVITAGLPLVAKGSEIVYTKKIQPKIELRYWENVLKENDFAKYKEYIRLQRQAESLRGVSPNVKELDLSRLSLLKNYPEAQKSLIKYFSTKKGLIIGGSVAQQPQLEIGISKGKPPADIDAYLKKFTIKGENKGLNEIAKNVARTLRKGGVERVSKIGTKVSVKGEKLFEIHTYKSYLEANINAVIPFYRGAYESGITKTPMGTDILRLDIQLKRKLVGGYLERYMTGKLRIKDIFASKTIKKSLLKTQKIQKQKSIANILKQEVKEFNFKLFPESKIAKLGGEKGLKTPKTIRLIGEGLPKTLRTRGGMEGEYPSLKTSDYFRYAPRTISLSYARYRPKEVSPYTILPKRKITPTITYPKGKVPKKEFPYVPKYPPSFPSFTKLISPEETTTNIILFKTQKTSRKKLFKEVDYLGKSFSKFSYKTKDDLALVEGFISKTLGRKPKYIQEKDLLKEFKRYSSPFALRERPIVIK